MRMAAAAELHRLKWDQIESGGPGSGRHAGFGSGLKKGIGNFAQRVTNHLVKGGWKYGGRSGEGVHESRVLTHPQHGFMKVHGDGSWHHSVQGGFGSEPREHSSGHGFDSLKQHVANLAVGLSPQ